MAAKNANRNHYGRRIVQCRWSEPLLLALSIWLSPLSHRNGAPVFVRSEAIALTQGAHGKIWHQMGIVVALVVLAFAAEASSQ
jgi:hypothetical protein